MSMRFHRSGSAAEDTPPHAVAGDAQPHAFTMDSLGMTHLLRTESLTAICLLIMSACSLGFMLFFLRNILIPFAIAVFLMYLLQPMVNYLCKPPRRWCDKCSKRRGELCCEGMVRVTKSRTYSTLSAADEASLERQRASEQPKGYGCLNRPLIPRWIAVIMALTIAVCALGSIGVIMYGSVVKLQADFGKYEDGAERLAHSVDRWLKKYHYSLDDDFMPFLVSKVRNQVPRVLTLLLASMEYSFFVAVFLVYLLISPVKPIKSSVWGIIDLHVRRYIRLKTMVGLLAGIVVTAMLWLLSVQMAYVFGLITFVLNFVPNLGPLVATFLPMPLVILDPGLSTLRQILAFVLPTMAHMVIGNFVEPGLFGDSFELSPVVVLLSLAFWGSLWGIPGMILAVPLIVIARIVCDHLDHPYAKTIMRLLEGNVFEAREDDTLIPDWNRLSTRKHSSGFVEFGEWEDDRPDDTLVAAETGVLNRNPSSTPKGRLKRDYGSTAS